MPTHDELVAQKAGRIQQVHRMDPARTALLVIDFQRSFMDPDSSLYVPTAWDILPPVKKLVEFCRGARVPVIFTEFTAWPEIPTLRKDPFGPEHLVPAPGRPTGWGLPSGNSTLGMQGPESPDTIEELRPLPGEVVIRAPGLDKFYGTPLDLMLRALDVRYLMVTGMLADLCVAATVYAATSREYRVTAITDGITTIWPDVLKAVYDIFGRKLARLMTAAEAAAELVAAGR
ncbi:MAG TPA: isochorismatase family cysteine hydrolase [Anaeromyxobacter sp.]|nr:isochorismatase family cysteine hydrolase [Anaeromyxobacter sp.]